MIDLDIIPFLVLLTAVVMALAVLPDLLEIVTKYTAHCFFLGACAFLAVSMFVYKVDFGMLSVSAPNISVASIWISEEEKEKRMRMEITSCKIFVASELEPKIQKASLQVSQSEKEVTIGKTMWEECSKRFGMNYWKYDISVNGENGGQALCRAYRQSDYRSSDVDAWCNTVFAPRVQ